MHVQCLFGCLQFNAMLSMYYHLLVSIFSFLTWHAFVNIISFVVQSNKKQTSVHKHCSSARKTSMPALLNGGCPGNSGVRPSSPSSRRRMGSDSTVPTGIIHQPLKMVCNFSIIQ